MSRKRVRGEVEEILFVIEFSAADLHERVTLTRVKKLLNEMRDLGVLVIPLDTYMEEQEMKNHP